MPPGVEVPLLQWGAVGVLIILLSWAVGKLWSAYLAVNIRVYELSEKVTAVLKETSAAIAEFNTTQLESTRVISERIDLAGQIQRIGADVLALRGKPDA